MYAHSNYIDLMERVLSAYSSEDIDRYFQDVRTNGLKEHGFPRLTANIGILIAHGRRTDLLDRFIAMMDLCCQEIPQVKAANDFSVREVVCAILELEKSNAVPAAKLLYWKDLLKTISPAACYNVYAKDPSDDVHNWAAFTLTSEYMRRASGLADANREFIDLQAYSQLRRLDKNGMYRDPHEPMVYDLVTRGLFALLLNEGYEGEYKEAWQQTLEKTAIPTLLMQSVTGEIPYGGRSSQFIHNEAMIAILFEYYAKCYARRSDMETAGKFKAASKRALDSISDALSSTPISHIKNRFPVSSRYGCEKYAYFDKYMITAASYLYTACRLCDPSIPEFELDDNTGATWQTTEHFHKLFMRAGEYFAEYDYCADTNYDASGLGRLHRKGAPSAICLSLPGTDKPNYEINSADGVPFAIVPEFFDGKNWISGADSSVSHKIIRHSALKESAEAVITLCHQDKEAVKSTYLLDKNGLHITAESKSETGILLPAFKFDGEEHPEINFSGNTLSVKYQNWLCRYQAEAGTICDTGKVGYNRNGHYAIFSIRGKERAAVIIEITCVK